MDFFEESHHDRYMNPPETYITVIQIFSSIWISKKKKLVLFQSRIKFKLNNKLNPIWQKTLLFIKTISYFKRHTNYKEILFGTHSAETRLYD